MKTGTLLPNILLEESIAQVYLDTCSTDKDIQVFVILIISISVYKKHIFIYISK